MSNSGIKLFFTNFYILKRDFLCRLVRFRSATANLSQARSNILPQIFLTGCFLYERIETQNLGKDQSLAALAAVAGLRLTLMPCPSM